MNGISKTPRHPKTWLVAKSKDHALGQDVFRVSAASKCVGYGVSVVQGWSHNSLAYSSFPSQGFKQKGWHIQFHRQIQGRFLPDVHQIHTCLEFNQCHGSLILPIDHCQHERCSIITVKPQDSSCPARTQSILQGEIPKHKWHKAAGRKSHWFIDIGSHLDQLRHHLAWTSKATVIGVSTRFKPSQLTQSTLCSYQRYGFPTCSVDLRSILQYILYCKCCIIYYGYT